MIVYIIFLISYCLTTFRNVAMLSLVFSIFKNMERIDLDWDQLSTPHTGFVPTTPRYPTSYQN